MGIFNGHKVVIYELDDWSKCNVLCRQQQFSLDIKCIQQHQQVMNADLVQLLEDSILRGLGMGCMRCFYAVKIEHRLLQLQNEH